VSESCPNLHLFRIFRRAVLLKATGRTPSPYLAPLEKNEAIREPEHMSVTSDMVPSVMYYSTITHHSSDHKDSDFAMIDSLDLSHPSFQSFRACFRQRTSDITAIANTDDGLVALRITTKLSSAA
jgi:hypothetical protein